MLPPQNNDPLIGRTLAGRYLVTSRIGRGGAGTVYRAMQDALGREVAVKLLRVDLDDGTREEFEARFQREAAMAARLSHPNIVTVHDFGVTEDGNHFVVMELLRGRSLKAAYKGACDPAEACRIGAEIARGLKHAHTRGMVHRDIKPSNVILVEDDEGVEHALIVDFGLAKVTDDDTITAAGTYMGTPGYMAPEQARGAEVDHRADLYSLGCLVYRLVAGVPPFEGTSAVATALAHLKQPYPPIAQRVPGRSVDPRLEAILRKCMEKDPPARYQDAAELARDLLAVRDSVATATPTLVAPRTAARRRRLPIALLALALGTCGVPVAGGLSWLGYQAIAPEAPPPPRIQPVTLAPAPVPVPVPEPEPVAAPAPEPVAAPAPAPVAPRPKPAPAPVPGRAVVIDGVLFSADHAARALVFVNTASADDLRKAGVYGRGVTAIIDARPFASLADVGAVPFVGEKSIRAIELATEE